MVVLEPFDCTFENLDRAKAMERVGWDCPTVNPFLLREESLLAVNTRLTNVNQELVFHCFGLFYSEATRFF